MAAKRETRGQREARESRNARRRELYAEQKKQGVQRITKQWGNALNKARDTNEPEDWQRFRAIDRRRERVLEPVRSRKQWARMLQEIAEAADEVFDVEHDTSLEGT